MNTEFKDTYLKKQIKISTKVFDETINIITCPEDVDNYFKHVISVDIQTQKCVIVLYFDRRNNIIGHHVNAIGGTHYCITDLKIMFSIALSCLATSIICIHNHPSGNLKPSEEDFKLFRKIKKFGNLIDITCLDFLIVTKDGSHSCQLE